PPSSPDTRPEMGVAESKPGRAAQLERLLIRTAYGLCSRRWRAHRALVRRGCALHHPLARDGRFNSGRGARAVSRRSGALPDALLLRELLYQREELIVENRVGDGD